MPRIKNGILYVTIVLLMVTSQAQGQTNGLRPPIDTNETNSITRSIPGPGFVSPFLPLIGDVIDRAAYRLAFAANEPTAAACQLNPPLSLAPESNHSNCDTAGCRQSSNVGGWVVTKGPGAMLVTPEIRIQNECPHCDLRSIELTNCQTCGSDNELECSGETNSSADPASLDKYCDQVATNLMTTLNGSANNPEAQRRAIQTALKMVAEEAELAASVDKEKTETAHRLTLKRILMEHARKSQPGLMEGSKSLLEPVYATQFRNTKQLKELADTDQSIFRSLLELEKKFASFTIMQRAKLSGSDVRRMMNSLEVEEAREKEVAKLQAELQVLDQRIQQLQNPVRPANYLEPIYMPAEPLRPIQYPFMR